MGLQTIINKCDSITIDRRRVVGVQYTRSEIAKTSETPTRNPWRLNLTISAGLKYGDNRALLEELDTLDKNTPEVVSFGQATGASPGLAYMFAYQGVLNPSQITGIRVSSFVGNQLILNVSLITPSSVTGQAGGLIFKKGDFIQVQGYPYPFTIRQDVVRGTADTVTLTTHRPNFISASLTGLLVNVGNACQFNVFCPNMPTYKLSPGGQNALISFSGEFQLYEYTGTV
jgi:hypothetical protein